MTKQEMAKEIFFGKNEEQQEKAKETFMASVHMVLENVDKFNPLISTKDVEELIRNRLNWASVLEIISQVYCERFDEEEMKLLHEFCTSNVGRKLMEMTPELNGDIAERVQLYVDDNIREILY